MPSTLAQSALIWLALFVVSTVSPRPPSPPRSSPTLSAEGFILDSSGTPGVDAYNAIFGETLLLLEYLKDAEETLKLTRGDHDWDVLKGSLAKWDRFCEKMESKSAAVTPTKEEGRRRRLGRSVDGEANTRSCAEWAQLARALVDWVQHLGTQTGPIADEVACTLKQKIGEAEELAKSNGQIERLVDKSLGIVEDQFRPWDAREGRKMVRLNFGLTRCDALTSRMPALRKFALRPLVRPGQQGDSYSTVELIDQVIDVYVEVQQENARAFRSSKFVVHFLNKETCLSAYSTEELNQLMAKYDVQNARQNMEISASRLSGRSSVGSYSVQQGRTSPPRALDNELSSKYRFDSQQHRQTASVSKASSSSSSSPRRQYQHSVGEQNEFGQNAKYSSKSTSSPKRQYQSFKGEHDQIAGNDKRLPKSSSTTVQQHSDVVLVETQRHYDLQKEHFEELTAKLKSAKKQHISEAELDSLKRLLKVATQNLISANLHLQEQMDAQHSNDVIQSVADRQQKRTTTSKIASNVHHSTFEYGGGESRTSATRQDQPGSSPKRERQNPLKTSSSSSRSNSPDHESANYLEIDSAEGQSEDDWNEAQDDIAKYADYNRFSLKGWRDWQIQIDREPKGAQRKGTPISQEHAEKCSRLEEEAARLFTAIRASEAEVQAELKKARHAEYQGDFYYFPGKFPDDDDWIKNNSEYYVGLRKREKELERTLKIVVRCYGVLEAFLSNGVGVYSEFLRMERGLAENEFEEMTAVQEAGRDLAHYAEVQHLVEGTVAAYEQIMPEGEKKLTEKELQDRQIHENAVKYHGGPTKAFYW